MELYATLSCGLCFASHSGILPGEPCPEHPGHVRVSESSGMVRVWCSSHLDPQVEIHQAVTT